MEATEQKELHSHAIDLTKKAFKINDKIKNQSHIIESVQNTIENNNQEFNKNQSIFNIAIQKLDNDNRNLIILGNLKIKVNNLLQDGLTIINNTINIDKEITDELNKSQVGTLQGIARQTVFKNEIKPVQYDVVAQEILEQPYDERAHINFINRNENTGGRKRKIKTNKKNNKNNKKSIKKI